MRRLRNGEPSLRLLSQSRTCQCVDHPTPQGEGAVRHTNSIQSHRSLDPAAKPERAERWIAAQSEVLGGTDNCGQSHRPFRTVLCDRTLDHKHQPSVPHQTLLSNHRHHVQSNQRTFARIHNWVVLQPWIRETEDLRDATDQFPHHRYGRACDCLDHNLRDHIDKRVGYISRQRITNQALECPSISCLEPYVDQGGGTRDQRRVLSWQRLHGLGDCICILDSFDGFLRFQIADQDGNGVRFVAVQEPGEAEGKRGVT